MKHCLAIKWGPILYNFEGELELIMVWWTENIGVPPLIYTTNINFAYVYTHKQNDRYTHLEIQK